MAGEKDGVRPLAKAYTPGRDINAGYQPEASIADFVPPQGGSGLAPEPPAARAVAGPSAAGGEAAGGQGSNKK